MYLRQPETTVTGETNIMRIYYSPIVLNHKVSGTTHKDIHNEIKNRIFHKNIRERIGHLYTPILAHILEPYMQSKHKHDTFGY